jgi:hypothetical protein
LIVVGGAGDVRRSMSPGWGEKKWRTHVKEVNTQPRRHGLKAIFVLMRATVALLGTERCNTPSKFGSNASHLSLIA